MSYEVIEFVNDTADVVIVGHGRREQEQGKENG